MGVKRGIRGRGGRGGVDIIYIKEEVEGDVCFSFRPFFFCF